MRRLMAVALMCVFSASALPGTCFGWSVSASARMACCQRAHHAHCAEQTAANTCCARQEQSRPILLFSGMTVQSTGIHQSPVAHGLPPGDHSTPVFTWSVGTPAPKPRTYRPPRSTLPPLRI